ncbi:putative SesB-related regulatory protein [Hyaloscypha variabilis F]|uniref:Putative SesB-related regulatory protein n=1 Tax=Hyaloscypha variabilis (strain UAMH 11265 / GT02V1 / F) TaxID=1149755 RepID=A0A2J6QYU3_HYAVF|nr:putative SesB-related regulatory protein [Hyaloscypha variabilis F]
MAFLFGRKRKRSHDQDQDHESDRGDPAMSTSSAILQNHSYGLKVLEEPQNAAGIVFDVVFVHGLRGSIETTWRHNRTGAYWPRDFLSKDLSNCRIFAFGYDADIVNFWNPASKNRIGNHAENLIGALAGEREITDTNSRKIIFIGHSLGGLVIQQALCHSKNSVEEHIQKIHECTAAIMFLGTPHFGADMAKWAAFGSHMSDSFKRTNSDIVNVLKLGSEMLANIQGNFHSILRTREKSDQRIQITCFYEELALSYVGEVVPMHSAILPSYPSYGIHANHMDMTKFPSCDDAGYGSIRRELLRWTKQLSTAGPTPLALNCT